ncbi:phosphoesterase [Salinigranum rubrum]|uniref:Phosphoesterase n=1 Tax=Salinigranum rubrum TaxID=755307 RepID=A0A2I8VIJ0_9EURY|nr:metallophosphoesterase [Salinigranum rubrum]AUV81746.1 phosphoesterase [Salinigranum rubrum]
MSRRARVEPVPGEPAAVARTDSERVLVVADYHAGIEAGLRYERGVELESAADVRLARLERLLDRTGPDRLLVLGDLVHRIGPPDGDEVDELVRVVDRVTDRVPMTLVPGNHDGGVADAVAERAVDLAVVDSGGIRFGPVGFVHGHTWPASDVLRAEVVCMGHEHPTVKLADEVGGSRVERAWLRGRLDRSAFEGHVEGARNERVTETELVVVPAFNDRSGGTWVNVDGQTFLSPFLPDALPDGELYLLDGTRLGHYRRV